MGCGTCLTRTKHLKSTQGRLYLCFWPPQLFSAIKLNRTTLLICKEKTPKVSSIIQSSGAMASYVAAYEYKMHLFEGSICHPFHERMSE